MSEPTIREPDDIRQDCARKLRAIEVSDHFQAILACLLGEDWTTPRLVEMVITPDDHLLGRCDGEVAFKACMGPNRLRSYAMVKFQSIRLCICPRRRQRWLGTTG